MTDDLEDGSVDSLGRGGVMRFGSVCSGIEAASVAWSPLGWEAAWLAEIEPFPCSLLAHHYPDVPNLGDMTKFESWPTDDQHAIDLLCGGTPCQSFSVAGLRKGLDDPRGNLMLTFGAIAAKYRPQWLVWENVPGVLSSNGGRDFGSFLGMLGQLGYGFAYRVLDAQYFGVAQRRRRVFVVGCFGDWRSAAAVLFERHSLQGHPAPRRKAGKAAPTIPARSSGGGGLGTDFDCDGGLIAGTMKSCNTSGGWSNSVDHAAAGYMVPVPHATISPALKARDHKGVSSDGDGDGAILVPMVAHSLRGDGFDASEDGTGRGTPLVPVAYRTAGDGAVFEEGDVTAPLTTGTDPSANVVGFAQNQRDEVRTMQVAGALAAEPGAKQQTYVAQPAIALQGNMIGRADTAGPAGRGISEDGISFTLTKTDVHAVCFDTTQVTSKANRSNPKYGDPCHPLADGAHAPAIAQIYSGTETNSGENKGFHNLESEYASTQETDAVALLRRVRETIGAQAFAQWGLGILDSLQSPEILRQALHGLSIRPAAFSRSWVVHCALSRSENGSGWLLQSLREAGCERCASQGWEPSEQLAGKLGAYLSELSQPGAQAARLMRDLWFASEGVGLLQQALLAVQEVGRSAGHKGQSVLRGSEGRRAETPEAVPSAGMQCEVSRERVLHQACAAGKARDSREGATEQERSGKGRVGETPFAVRRLTVEECEFLQGFPRGYSKIPWRKKPADQCPDGPRYKALGNSWAVPNVRWIGQRIEQVIAAVPMNKATSAIKTVAEMDAA